jgi:3-oxoacyl-[acyl-carrier protein] reductase
MMSIHLHVLGIGTVIAENLASKGCDLVLNYTSGSSKSRTESLSEALASKHNIRTLVAQADLGSPEGPAALVSATEKAFATGDGKFQIDIIINNAGVAITDFARDVKVADFDISYRINVLGPLLLVQAAEPYLPTDRSGRIVNISSVSSSTGFITQSVYGGTKAALEAMTRTWARELSERCTVNAINPGPVLTEMYANVTDTFVKHIKPFIEHAPLMRTRQGIDAEELCDAEPRTGGRPAYGEEVAGMVGLLCSSEAGWCTGQVVSANGGMLFGMQ